jgi:hypothetical protein
MEKIQSKTFKTAYGKYTIWTNEKMEFHREDGPAIEWSSGDKQWWMNGKCHRLDGPASIMVTDSPPKLDWYINGVGLYIY